MQRDSSATQYHSVSWSYPDFSGAIHNIADFIQDAVNMLDIICADLSLHFKSG